MFQTLYEILYSYTLRLDNRIMMDCQRRQLLWIYLLITSALPTEFTVHVKIPQPSGSACSVPPNFPPDLELYKADFLNWDNALKVPGLWNGVPKTRQEVLKLVNWAHQNRWKVRASGYMHNWAPTTVVQNTKECEGIILMKTKALTDMRMSRDYSFPAVWVQSGASLEALMTFLEGKGYGLAATPAPGTISLGGLIAVAGHGTGIPAAGEPSTPGKSFGSVSNLILDLTAVVWDPTVGEYVLKTFLRSEPEAKAFLTSLGRTIILDMTIRVISNYNIRCQSRLDIPAEELFADPANVTKSTRTISSFIEATGRVETILFPFTTRPWLKIWTPSPHRPLLSRLVTEPYSYPFSNLVPLPVAQIVTKVMNGFPELAPALGIAQYASSIQGLKASLAFDLWGKSKNLWLYIQDTTLRVHESGAAIMTSRRNIQHVVSDSFVFFNKLVKKYEARGLWPINGPVEIRVSGLDDPEDSGIPGAEAPSISPVNPDKSDFDVCVWFNILAFPSTPYMYEFLGQMETYFYEKYTGDTGLIVPEWSKGWAYSRYSSWSDPVMLRTTIPKLFPHWNFTVYTLDKYDPHKVFTNEFLNDFLRS